MPTSIKPSSRAFCLMASETSAPVASAVGSRSPVSRAGHHQVAVQLVVLLADFAHLGVLVPQGIRPVPGRALRDVHGLNRVLAGVPVDLALVHGNAGNRLQLLGDGNRNGCVAQVLARPPYLMTDGQHILLLLVG